MIFMGLISGTTAPLYIKSYKEPKVSFIFSIGLQYFRIFSKNVLAPILEDRVNQIFDFYPIRTYTCVFCSYSLISIAILAPLDVIQFEKRMSLKRIISLALAHTVEALVFHSVFSNLEKFLNPNARNYHSMRYISVHILSLITSSFLGNIIQNSKISLSKVLYKITSELLIQTSHIINPNHLISFLKDI